MSSEITRGAHEGCKDLMPLPPAAASRYGVVSRDFLRHVLYYHCFGGPAILFRFSQTLRAHIFTLSRSAVSITGRETILEMTSPMPPPPGHHTIQMLNSPGACTRRVYIIDNPRSRTRSRPNGSKQFDGGGGGCKLVIG